MSKNCLKNQYQAKILRRFTYQAKTLWIHDHWTLTHLSIKNAKPTDPSIVSQTPLYVQKLLKNQYQANIFRRFTYQAKSLWIHDHWTLTHLSIKNTKPTDLSIVSQTPLYVQKLLKNQYQAKNFRRFTYQAKVCGFTIIGP